MTSVHSRYVKPSPSFGVHLDEIQRDGDIDEIPDVEEHENVEMDYELQGDEVFSEGSDDTEDAVDPSVQEDIEKFQQTFSGHNISKRYRLINRIGEGRVMRLTQIQHTNEYIGTFSTVYKAEDLEYEKYDNYWDLEEKDPKWTSPPLRKRAGSYRSVDETKQSKRKPRYVAIKKIYVTSSPSRILNELDLLYDLRGCNSVCPLITAFRSTDQVVAVLPYFKHTDFREYFRNMTVPDMQIYFRSLFTALAAVHAKGIIHRDIKPTNFLYEPSKQRGVLVDFGLAEREGWESRPCLCNKSASHRRERIQGSVAAITGPSTGYPKNDSRPSRRANRAGTRGFRAPEVLLKCTDQQSKLDIWSAGVILLTILSRRFPFFNSADDVEAMIEIATIFGVRRMKQCALLHGTVFETNIPTIGNAGFSLEKIIMWSTCRDGDEVKPPEPLTDEEKLAVRFLERCFELDPNKRISAEEALQHEFLREHWSDEEEISMIDAA